MKIVGSCHLPSQAIRIVQMQAGTMDCSASCPVLPPMQPGNEAACPVASFPCSQGRGCLSSSFVPMQPGNEAACPVASFPCSQGTRLLVQSCVQGTKLLVLVLWLHLALTVVRHWSGFHVTTLFWYRGWQKSPGVIC